MTRFFRIKAERFQNDIKEKCRIQRFYLKLSSYGALKMAKCRKSLPIFFLLRSSCLGSCSSCVGNCSCCHTKSDGLPDMVEKSKQRIRQLHFSVFYYFRQTTHSKAHAPRVISKYSLWDFSGLAMFTRTALLLLILVGHIGPYKTSNFLICRWLEKGNMKILKIVCSMLISKILLTARSQQVFSVESTRISAQGHE